MKIKTKAEWKESGKPFEEFFNIDDVVDDEIANHFFKEPSSTWNGRTLQLGAASKIINGRPLYQTLEMQSNGFWTYNGLKPRHKNYTPV